MKRTFVASVAFATMAAGSAMAADVDFKAAPYADPPFSWTGCYAGIHAGGGFHTSSFVDEEDVGGIGAVAGGQAGCNYQVSRLVVGLEGELYWSGLNTKRDEADGFDTFHVESDNRYDASIALRLGYAFDRLLAYGKIGVNASRFQWSGSENEIGDFADSVSAAQTVLGLLLGVGFEYALADRWSVKLEYNYINFGDPSASFTESCAGAGCGVAPISTFTETEKEIKQILKIGLNYKFY